MRILIAEDDQVLADGLLRSLRAAGYAVDQVSSGGEADAALAAHEFDMVILDLGLPRMHGFEVLRKLRGRGSAVPVLILTAADSVEQRVKGLDLGADDYMAKPFSLQELEARVRALTGDLNALLQRHHDLTTAVPASQFTAVQRWDREALSYAATGQRCDPFLAEEPLFAGGTMQWAGQSWTPLAAPGHDPHALMLWRDDVGVLVAGDALWENGFGVVFPELEGVDAFNEVAEVLDLIETLPGCASAQTFICRASVFL